MYWAAWKNGLKNLDVKQNLILYTESTFDILWKYFVNTEVADKQRRLGEGDVFLQKTLFFTHAVSRKNTTKAP